MSATVLRLDLDDRGIRTPLEARIGQAVIAGWTGRDPTARDRHIAELQALGIAPPATTPIFYRVAASRLTTASAIDVTGEETSGEVEFVLLRFGGRTYVTVGSDHTDRKLETVGVTLSKQVCDKPLAATLWRYDEVATHWDRLLLRSWAITPGGRDLYQEGEVAGMLAPGDLLARGFADAALPEGSVLFGGTLPAKGGIRPAERFEFELEDPVLGRVIRHGYDIACLPVLG